MTNRHTTDEMMGMTSEVHRQRAARISRATMGERLGGFIYGTIVALAVVVAGARAYPQGAGHIAALVAATSVAFWLAHVYSLALAHSVANDQHLSFGEVPRTARREGPMIAVPREEPRFEMLRDRPEISPCCSSGKLDCTMFTDGVSMIPSAAPIRKSPGTKATTLDQARTRPIRSPIPAIAPTKPATIKVF